MVSLTTVYAISIMLTSLAGIGSAFMGNKFTGGALMKPPTEKEEPPVAPVPSVEEEEESPVQEEEQPAQEEESPVQEEEQPAQEEESPTLPSSTEQT